VWQINDLHSSFGIGNSSLVPKRWRSIISRFFNKMMANMVNEITVNVSKNVDRVFEKFSVKARLIYCGVDLPVNINQPFIQGTPFRVLSTGVFFRYRNYENLVLACVNARKISGEDIVLTIVGDTRYAPEYVNEIRALADVNALPLIVKENISDAELDAEIGNAHVFAFVNIDQSWGLAVFESAARGRAVILSESVGASELLNNLPGFKLVDPTSVDEIALALYQLQVDRLKCQNEGIAAALAVKDMSWNNMYCLKVENLFKMLLSSN
jgi:glycosyltransferase involved in cell wall biosynthesis